MKPYSLYKQRLFARMTFAVYFSIQSANLLAADQLGVSGFSADINLSAGYAFLNPPTGLAIGSF